MHLKWEAHINEKIPVVKYKHGHTTSDTGSYVGRNTNVDQCFF